MKYKVAIREELVRYVEIEAEDANLAEEAVRDKYRAGEIVLDSDDYVDTDFSVVSNNDGFHHTQILLKEKDVPFSRSVVFSDGIEANVNITKKDGIYVKNISLYDGFCKVADDSCCEPVLPTTRKLPYYSDTYCVSIAVC